MAVCEEEAAEGFREGYPVDVNVEEKGF